MCDLPDTGLPIVDDVIDIVEDVFEGITDIIADVISWIVPIPDIPDFNNDFNNSVIYYGSPTLGLSKGGKIQFVYH